MTIGKGRATTTTSCFLHGTMLDEKRLTRFVEGICATICIHGPNLALKQESTRLVCHAWPADYQYEIISLIIQKMKYVKSTITAIHSTNICNLTIHHYMPYLLLSVRITTSTHPHPHATLRSPRSPRSPLYTHACLKPPCHPSAFQFHSIPVW